jgi:hypothetical protein
VTPDPPRDWASWIRQRLDPSDRHHVLSLSYDDEEVKRFCELWPRVAAVLGIHEDPGPWRAFDPGLVHYPRNTGAGPFSAAWWRAHVDRHTSADHGLREDLAAENAAAIAADRGAVRSRYLLDAADQARFPKFSYRPKERYCVDLVTALAGRHTITLAIIESIDE